MKYYVVIDTNVFVAALLSSDANSSTVKVIKKLYQGDLIPLYSDETLDEYKDVLNRKKFCFQNYKIGDIVNAIRKHGIYINPKSININLPDGEDVKFYELVMDKTIANDKFLVTGNIKHFPKNPIIITPSEFMKIYDNNK